MSESNKRSIVQRSECIHAGPSVCSEDAAEEQDGHPVTSGASHWLFPVGKKNANKSKQWQIWSLMHSEFNRCLVWDGTSGLR